jgi:hypothetical protein
VPEVGGLPREGNVRLAGTWTKVYSVPGPLLTIIKL